ncbi:MFS transporter [Sporosarcina sp. P26b]|uniref:MFS transporter n=1 Tax=Sporosarcina TaxID=1569 RepID=UPI000A17A9F0|nr:MULTISPECIES: MFS transporter [Sporosarcina]ARK21062.1 MFS transporter [Sporosarcina ureae]PIC73397.1 MFS transporter [Sporosarcina sp. P17b]PIC94572.1 MFS transporter [Sporosarcina sp. P26b]
MVSKKQRNLILLLLFIGWAIGNFDRYFINYAILSITEDLQLSPTSTGLILSSFFAGYALMQIPGGWLADKFGSRRVLIVSVLMWSIFTAATGAVWSLTSMIIIRFLFGIGEGGFQPSSSKLISQTFPSSKRAWAMSIMLSTGGIVSLIVPVLSVYLLTTIGWRVSFLVLGGIGLIITVLYWAFIRLPEGFKEEEFKPVGENQEGVFKQLIKTPLMLNLFIAYYSIYAINWGLATWLPTYLVNVRGLDLISLGWVQTIPGLAMVLAIFLSGYVIDRLPEEREKVMGAIACVLIGIILYLMFNAPNVTMFITYQTIVIMFISFIILLLPSIILKRFPSTVVGTSMGIANTGGQLAGFITPLAIGFIVQMFNGSYNAAFWMLIIFAVICTVSLLTLNYRKGELLQAEQ